MMSTIIDQINKIREQLGISASQEEILAYFSQPSRNEAVKAWKEFSAKWNQEQVPEEARNGRIPWPDILGSLYEHPEDIQTTDECCSLCHHKLLLHDFRSPAWTWASLCGRGGRLTFCPNCLHQESFSLDIMN